MPTIVGTSLKVGNTIGVITNIQEKNLKVASYIFFGDFRKQNRYKHKASYNLPYMSHQ